jgi:cysteinyl-tRNA synthetase
LNRYKIVFFDSLENKKKDFIPNSPEKVKIYSCGPTVYNYSHIGNIRSYIFVDILRRSLKILGYIPDQTMNITDIDDKIIRESIANQISIEEFTKPWIEIFFHDLELLNVEKVEHYPLATNSINQMVDLVQRLASNGLTYEKDGNIYFSIDKFKNYGLLSKIDKSGIKSGARYDADEYEKDNVRDFVLWKAPKEEKEKCWHTNIGTGRPGWHLECSAMIRQIYSSGLDIHTGGIDLLFPHHENEIAQSEGAYPSEKFVNTWLHCEHLLVDGQKMSKSKGNFYTLKDLLDKGYDWKSIRYVLLSFHYRTKLNFSWERLKEATLSISKIQNTLNRVLRLISDYKFEFNSKNLSIQELQANQPNGIANKFFLDFIQAIADDLNTPIALASIFESCKKINSLLDEENITQENLEDLLKYFYQINALLGILEFEKSISENLETMDSRINELIQERIKAKQDKDFKKADEIREMLKQQGILLEDTKDGSVKWKKIP